MLVNTLLHRKTQNTACYVFCLHVCNILTFRNNVKLKSASSGPVLKLILWCVFVNFCCMGGRGTRLLRVLFPRFYLRVLFANSFRRFCCKYAVYNFNVTSLGIFKISFAKNTRSHNWNISFSNDMQIIVVFSRSLENLNILIL